MNSHRPSIAVAMLPAVSGGVLLALALSMGAMGGETSSSTPLLLGVSLLVAVAGALWSGKRLGERTERARTLARSEQDHLTRACERAAFADHPLPMWIYDVQTLRIVDVNLAAIEKYGYTREQFLCKSIAELRPSQDVPALKARVSQLLGTITPDAGRWRHLTADGRLMTVDVYGRALDIPGRSLRIVCTIDRAAEQDAIEELLRLQGELAATVAQRTEELATREAMYRGLADLSPQILWQADHTGRVVYVNRSWDDIVGLRNPQTSEPRWLAALHPDDRAQTMQAYATSLEQGTQMRLRRRFRSKQGDYRSFLSVATPMIRADGSISGWVGVDTDVTEMERHAQRLAETNAELETMSYTVSHDLRAPVQVIKGFVEAVLSGRKGQIDDAARDALDRVHRQSLRMDELITDLLGLARLSRESLHPQPIDPLQLAQEVAVFIQDRYPDRGIECATSSTDGEAVTLWGDRRLFRGLLENLLDNAVKFSPDQPVCRVEVQAHRGHDEVVLRVCDRGIGFPPDLASRLFRPFQRLHAGARFPGTGVGLATVRRIVRLHCGSIEGHNREGGGAMFEIRMPQRFAPGNTGPCAETL